MQVGPTSAYSSALTGIRAAQDQLFESARTIALGNIDDYAVAFVGMMQARTYFAANVKVVQAQNQMDRSLLDIFV